MVEAQSIPVETPVAEEKVKEEVKEEEEEAPVKEVVKSEPMEKAVFEETEALRKIFSGGLNRETTDDEFKEYFTQFGETADTVIIRDPSTQASRGFGFVTYKTVESTDACIAKKKDGGHQLGDKNIEVKRAIPKEFDDNAQHQKVTRFFLGGIKEGITQDNVKEYFELNFPLNVESVDLIREKKDTVAEGQEPKLRGFGFVTVDDTDMVDKIIIIKKHEIAGISLDAKKAAPRDGSSSGGRGGGRGRGRGRGGRGGNRGGGGYGGGGYGAYGGGGYGGYGGGYGGYGGYGAGGGYGGGRYHPY